MKKLSILLLATCSVVASTSAQDKKGAVKDSTEIFLQKREAASNVMLNASDDQGPRKINVGLPFGTTGTPVAENGLLITYDPQGQRAVQAWRQDGSFKDVKSLTLAQTAILYGDISASVSTYSNKGTETFKGGAGFTTNSFGLLRGNVSVSGPAKNDLYYALNAFIDMDPGTFRSDINRFLDQTYILKGVLNKKYNNKKGEIGIQMKYADAKSVSNKKNPYIYRSDGKVDALPGMTIGEDAYQLRSKDVWIVDPLTGDMKLVNLMDDTGSQTFAVEVFGKNKLENDYSLDYIIRYNYANSGLNSADYNKISESGTPSNTKRFIYADNTNEQVYTGYVQNASMSVAPKSKKQTLQTRIDLNKSFTNNKLNIGIDAQYYNVDKATKATFSYLQEVANNPRPLIQQSYDGTQWVNANNADEHGQWNYNGSLQYYDGHEVKAAIYVVDNWDISRKLNIELGMRLENHSFDGNWYPKANRDAAAALQADGRKWVSGETEKIDHNFFNKNFTLSILYKIHKTWGVTGEASYFEKGGNLSAYAGADNPQLKQSKTPFFSAGIYYNNKFVSLVSKVSQIRMSNIGVNGSFNNDAGQTLKKTFNYNVKTVGWTTDVVLRPFTGFNMHLLLTMQNPKYDKFEFDVFGENYDYAGNRLRGISKTLIEIDPSYTWKNFKLWLSARYYSKEAANYPNSVYFASRWETFAGFDYKYNKNVNFSINAVNLLNQAGAQGSVSGGNTITDGSVLYNTPIAGSYIRPFTIEFKTNVKF